MADTYYYASNINSFPTTKRESVNKLITENSLTRLINRLLDTDSFIISDGLAKRQNGVASEVIGNGGEHLEINSNLRLDSIDFKDNIIEFVIRGYYFSADLTELLNSVSWDSYISTHPTQDTIGLFARIFIDNTNPDYPELVGQTAYEDNSPGADSEDAYYGVQFFICPMEGGVFQKPAQPFHVSLPTTTTSGITTITGLGTTYTYYDLLLVEYIKNNELYSNGSYIPFDSLYKFDSHSVKIIDGGEFKFY